MRPSAVKKNRLSLCMIVKNEEQYLFDCLKSVEDVVDEVVIVDTGSEDSTLDIAEKFNAKIYHYPWKDDFSAARNESLKHATCEWILQLDADERLCTESKAELKKRLKDKKYMCVNVVIDSPKADQKKGHISRAHRLFRNIPGMKYSGRIHEQVSPAVMALKGKEGFSSIKLIHLGYAKDEGAMEEKSLRNSKLLKQQISEEPNNAYWRFTYAQNLVLNREYSEAEEHLKKALELGGLPKDILCSIYNNFAEIKIKKGDYRNGVEQAQQSIKLNPAQTTSYLLMYEAYGYLKQIENQIFCLEKTIALVEKNSRNTNQTSLEAYVDITSLYLNLGARHFQSKDFLSAKAAFQNAVKISPENIMALQGYSDCLIQIGEFDTAEEVLSTLGNLNPDDPVILEKRAFIFMRLKKFEQAITAYELLSTRVSRTVALSKRLAGLYNLIGDREKAEMYLQESVQIGEG